jgi:hypothetical protein
VKVIGDPYVPSAEVTWRTIEPLDLNCTTSLDAVREGPLGVPLGHDGGADGTGGADSTDSTDSTDGTDGTSSYACGADCNTDVRVAVAGEMRVAARGFENPQWMPCTITIEGTGEGTYTVLIVHS